jgi:hypothetical protein
MTTLSEKNEDKCSPSPSPKKLNRQFSLNSDLRSDFDGRGTESIIMGKSAINQDTRSAKSDDSPMKKKY